MGTNFKEGEKGEIFAYRWLVENKDSIFPQLNIDLDCEIYWIVKEDSKDKALPADIKVFIRDVVQYNWGIDIVIGKFISERVFECQLTIDVKNSAKPYFELYGNQHFAHKDLYKTWVDEFGKRQSEKLPPEKKKMHLKRLAKILRILRILKIKKKTEQRQGTRKLILARKSISMRYDTCVDNADDFDWGSDYANSKLKKPMFNSYAQSTLFVQHDQAIVIGSAFTSMPIIFTNDLLGGLREKYIIGGKMHIPRGRNDIRHLEDHIAPYSYAVFGGVHIHLKFDYVKTFFTELDNYKKSCSKENSENHSTFKITNCTEFDTVDVNDSLQLKIPVGKYRVLIEFDNAGLEIARVRIDDRFEFVDENTGHISDDDIPYIDIVKECY